MMRYVKVVFFLRNRATIFRPELLLSLSTIYKDATTDFRTYEAIFYHRDATKKAMTFLCVMEKINRGTPIEVLSKPSKKRAAKFARIRGGLKGIIRAVLYCIPQNIGENGNVLLEKLEQLYLRRYYANEEIQETFITWIV